MIMDEKVEYYKLPFYKRMSAMFIDISVLILLFTILLFPISSIISNQIAKNEKIGESMRMMNNILLESELFVINDQGSLEEDISDESIIKGYNYFNDLSTYLDIKEKSELFIFENEEYIEVGTKEELNKFYKDNWKIIYERIVTSSEYDKYNQVYIEEMNRYNAITYSSDLIICLVLLFITIPLFNKKGKTIGKFIFKIDVVNDTYEVCNKLQLFVRQFFFSLFLLLSIITLPISLVLVLFTKKGKALHDYIAISRVIDSLVLKGMQEEKKKEKQIDELDFKGGD